MEEINIIVNIAVIIFLIINYFQDKWKRDKIGDLERDFEELKQNIQPPKHDPYEKYRTVDGLLAGRKNINE